MLGLFVAAAVLGMPIGGAALVSVPDEQVAKYFECLVKERAALAKRYVAAEPGSAEAERVLTKLDGAIFQCMKPLGCQYMKGSPDWYRNGLASALQQTGADAPKTP
jgi:hypothetical protein